jgi:hypothetical protein
MFRELEMTGEEAGVAYFQVLFRNELEGSEERETKAVRIGSISAETQTGYLPSTCQESYRFSKPDP